MTRQIHGRVRGKTIELHVDPGLADGQEVEVSVKPLPGPGATADGLLRTAGALARARRLAFLTTDH